MTSSKRALRRRLGQWIEPAKHSLSLNPSPSIIKEIDPAGRPQLGLVAEDVEKVNPDLVVHDNEGKLYSVRYDQVNAMLLNEFLKDHRRVEEQQGRIAQLRSMVAQQQDGFEAKLAKQQKQIEALTARLQNVSAQLEVSKAAPQTVLNDR